MISPTRGQVEKGLCAAVQRAVRCRVVTLPGPPVPWGFGAPWSKGASIGTAAVAESDTIWELANLVAQLYRRVLRAL